MDIKKFRGPSEKKLCEWMDAKRGLGSKLSKSINKHNSFFAQLKQGKPMNADHLRAVLIVLGPEKVLELLSIGGEGDAATTNNTIDMPHADLVQKFQDKTVAKEANEALLKIEQASRAVFFGDRFNYFNESR